MYASAPEWAATPQRPGCGTFSGTTSDQVRLFLVQWIERVGTFGALDRRYILFG